MFQVEQFDGPKEKKYERAVEQLRALIEEEPNVTANLANACALLNHILDDVNWVGFYLPDETKNNEELVLGPFQGLPACIRIPMGKGVCGTAAREKKTIRVANVHDFPGHIACDAASNSEIVIPLLQNGRLRGVLDIDSPSKNRFDEIDEKGLEKFAETLVAYVW